MGPVQQNVLPPKFAQQSNAILLTDLPVLVFYLQMWLESRVTRRFEKMPNFSKSSLNSLQAQKGQNIYNKAQFESPKHLH